MGAVIIIVGIIVGIVIIRWAEEELVIRGRPHGVEDVGGRSTGKERGWAEDEGLDGAVKGETGVRVGEVDDSRGGGDDGSKRAPEVEHAV